MLHVILVVAACCGCLILLLVLVNLAVTPRLSRAPSPAGRLALRTKKAGFRTRAVRAEDRVTVRMYRGFREIRDGFGKNAAYLFHGFTGAILLVATAFWFVANTVPAAVLLLALFKTSFRPIDLALAACATALPIAARLALAAALRDPLCPSFTHPIMAAVWAGITCRSLYQRVVRKRLTWRGREFDARAARF